MLEKLDEVNWKEIESAVESAEKIPNLVRGLISPDKKIQQESFEDLQEFINHQGSIYEATSYTIPFLFELLPLDIGDSQKLITSLLLNSVPPERFWGRIHSVKFDQYSKSAWYAIADGFDILFALLDKEQKQTQIDAIHILVFIGALKHERIPLLVEKLKQIVSSDRDEAIRAVAIYDLGMLYEATSHEMASEKTPLINLFHANWNAESLTPVNFAFALSLCRLMKSELFDEIEDYLIHAIVEPIWKPNLLQKGIYISQNVIDGAGRMDTGAIVALWSLGLDRSIQAMGKVIHSVVMPDRARELSIFLLDWVWYQDILSNRPYSARLGVYSKSSESLDASLLNRHQKLALLIVLDSETVWKEPSNFLEMYGLPADPDKAKKILDLDNRCDL